MFPMISAGTSPLIWIDLGNDKPGMKLQVFEKGKWVDYIKDGERVFTPIKHEKLPPGKYRQV